MQVDILGLYGVNKASHIINLLMFKITLVAVLLAVILCRTYPIFKQCDDRWRNEQLGTSSNTICSAGCAMSSVAMGLAGIGKNYNPSTLNQWLKAHGGYVSGDLIVWGSITSLGLSFKGSILFIQGCKQPNQSQSRCWKRCCDECPQRRTLGLSYRILWKLNLCQ